MIPHGFLHTAPAACTNPQNTFDGREVSATSLRTVPKRQTLADVMENCSNREPGLQRGLACRVSLGRGIVSPRGPSAFSHVS
jgi:hypothetical protein